MVSASTNSSDFSYLNGSYQILNPIDNSVSNDLTPISGKKVVLIGEANQSLKETALQTQLLQQFQNFRCCLLLPEVRAYRMISDSDMVRFLPHAPTLTVMGFDLFCLTNMRVYSRYQQLKQNYSYQMFTLLSQIEKRVNALGGLLQDLQVSHALRVEEGLIEVDAAGFETLVGCWDKLVDVKALEGEAEKALVELESFKSTAFFKRRIRSNMSATNNSLCSLLVKIDRDYEKIFVMQSEQYFIGDHNFYALLKEFGIQYTTLVTTEEFKNNFVNLDLDEFRKLRMTTLVVSDYTVPRPSIKVKEFDFPQMLVAMLPSQFRNLTLAEPDTNQPVMMTPQTAFVCAQEGKVSFRNARSVVLKGLNFEDVSRYRAVLTYPQSTDENRSVAILRSINHAYFPLGFSVTDITTSGSVSFKMKLINRIWALQITSNEEFSIEFNNRVVFADVEYLFAELLRRKPDPFILKENAMMVVEGVKVENMEDRSNLAQMLTKYALDNTHVEVTGEYVIYYDTDIYIKAITDLSIRLNDIAVENDSRKRSRISDS